VNEGVKFADQLKTLSAEFESHHLVDWSDFSNCPNPTPTIGLDESHKKRSFSFYLFILPYTRDTLEIQIKKCDCESVLYVYITAGRLFIGMVMCGRWNRIQPASNLKQKF
jgi:hypothetical protein